MIDSTISEISIKVELILKLISKSSHQYIHEQISNVISMNTIIIIQQLNFIILLHLISHK